jgi:hypothetical protein
MGIPIKNIIGFIKNEFNPNNIECYSVPINETEEIILNLYFDKIDDNYICISGDPEFAKEIFLEMDIKESILRYFNVYSSGFIDIKDSALKGLSVNVIYK